MMFSDNPEKFFPYSRVEIVHFPNGADDPSFMEAPAISGPVPQMIRQTLLYLKTTVLQEKIRKVPGQPEAVRVWNYPYTALEEIVANALYHRDYQTREPVEIRIYPNFIVFLNYGGPGRNFDPKIVQTTPLFSRRYRNRRLGDFLKELDLTEGKATGIPIIKKALQDNGSPEVEFETDGDRSYFQVVLRVHAEFAAVEDSPIKNDAVDNIVVEGAIEGARHSTKRKLAVLLQAILYNEKKRVPDYSKITGMSLKMVERYIGMLRKNGLVDFTGESTQVGGYIVNPKLKESIK